MPPSRRPGSRRPGGPGPGQIRQVARRCVDVTVDDHVDPARDALRLQQPYDLGLLERAEPLARERHRTRDVAATHLTVQAPAVVGGERAKVDDGEVGVDETGGELVGGDGRRNGDRFEDAHRMRVPSRVRQSKTPATCRGSGFRRADRVRPSALRYTRRLPGRRGDTDRSTRSDGSASRREGCPVGGRRAIAGCA